MKRTAFVLTLLATILTACDTGSAPAPPPPTPPGVPHGKAAQPGDKSPTPAPARNTWRSDIAWMIDTR
jgi:hypothetical protein